MKDDIMRIYEKVHLVVTTPSRILDLMKKKVTNFGNLLGDELASKLNEPKSDFMVHIFYSSYLQNVRKIVIAP